MAGRIADVANHNASERRRCLSVDELDAFSTGRLPEQEIGGVYRHLTTCDTCSALLERLPATFDPLSSGLKALPPALPVLEEPELRRLQEAARKLPDRFSGARDRGHDSTVSSRQSTEESAIEIPIDPPHRGAGSSEETVSCTPLLPAQIGKYEIQSVLGEGAFGRVYLARDPGLGRLVALKTPRPGVIYGPAATFAFLQEARKAATLNHPGIVTIYEVGQDATHGSFIAMEYVAGKSLRQVIAGGRLPPERAARYVAQAAEAVHYAHKLGLVHRDLKPANLLVGDDDRIKVADFGLALFEEELRERAGEYAGTLAYISPEQLRGDTHHLDGRTDVYSLGTILYELLTGRRPFGGNSNQIAQEVLHRPPKPPRQIDDRIPAELESICLKCLAKDAEQRFPAAADLAAALHRVCSPPTISSPRSGWLAWGGAGIAIAVLLAAVAMASIFGSQAEEHVIPYQVDEVAEPFQPLRLLTREPRELFPPSQPTERWIPYPEREEVLMTIPTAFVLGLGKTNQDSFRLRVDISKTDQSGETGIFLGYQSVPPQDDYKRWIAELVYVKTYGDGKFFLERTRGEFLEAGGTFVLNTETIAVAELPRAEIKNASLEVVVRENQITEIHWMDRRIPNLIGRRAKNALPAYAGQFGVYATQGSAWFHKAEFRRLKPVHNSESAN